MFSIINAMLFIFPALYLIGVGIVLFAARSQIYRKPNPLDA